MIDYAYKKQRENNSLVKYWLAFVLILFFIFGLYVALSSYPERMKQINHHYCVEVYGLDENCK